GLPLADETGLPGPSRPARPLRGKGNEKTANPCPGGSRLGWAERMLPRFLDVALFHGGGHAHPGAALGHRADGREILLQKRLPHADPAADPRRLSAASV